MLKLNIIYKTKGKSFSIIHLLLYFGLYCIISNYIIRWEKTELTTLIKVKHHKSPNASLSKGAEELSSFCELCHVELHHLPWLRLFPIHKML